MINQTLDTKTTVSGPHPRGIDEFRRILHTIYNESFREVAASISDREMNHFELDLKSAIYTQSFHHAPLSPTYRDWKRRKGLDTRILIATGEYVRSIRRDPGETTDEEVSRGVVLPDAQHTGAEVPLKLLARWLEYGTARMPPRPHWRPKITELEDRMPTITREFERRMQDSVLRKAKARGLNPDVL